MNPHIYIWPDGGWCEEHELTQFQRTSGRSDDYAYVEIFPPDSDPEEFVQRWLNRDGRYKWELRHNEVGGHAIFIDLITGRYAISDKTGKYPEKTTDGVLWLDFTRPVVHAENQWAIPVLDLSGRKCSTPATPDEAAWCVETLRMDMQVGGTLFAPVQAIPVIEKKKNCVGDVSTEHITGNDGKLLEQGGVPGQIGSYEYGHVIVVNTSLEKVKELRELGMSDAYICLLRLAKFQGLHYLFLDQDGYNIEGAESFQW